MSWWKNLFHRDRDSDLDAELRYHVDRRIDDHVASGFTPAEARRRVRLAATPCLVCMPSSLGLAS